MMSYAKRGRFRVVVVWSLDWLGRRFECFDAYRALAQVGVDVMSCREPWTECEGPARDLLVSVMAWRRGSSREVGRGCSALARKESGSGALTSTSAARPRHVETRTSVGGSEVGIGATTLRPGSFETTTRSTGTTVRVPEAGSRTWAGVRGITMAAVAAPEPLR
jgi:hypothetical protein